MAENYVEKVKTLSNEQANVIYKKIKFARRILWLLLSINYMFILDFNYNSLKGNIPTMIIGLFFSIFFATLYSPEIYGSKNVEDSLLKKIKHEKLINFISYAFILFIL